MAEQRCARRPNLIYWAQDPFFRSSDKVQPVEIAMAPEEIPGIDSDVAEVRRRVDSLLLDLKSLGLDVEVSVEEYGPVKDPDGTITRTVSVNFIVWSRDY